MPGDPEMGINGYIKKAFLIALLFLLTSCAHGSQTYRDPEMDFASIKTVAVMPFVNLSHDNQAADRVRDVFSSMLLATGDMYVLPAGEVSRGLSRAGVFNPATPSAEEVVKLGKILNANAVITGVVREYGDVRSASASANVISVSAEMLETQTGKVVWKGASTKGGVTLMDRLLGGGGKPMDVVTEKAVNDLLDQLFK
jgi:hypothetical protein